MKYAKLIAGAGTALTLLLSACGGGGGGIGGTGGGGGGGGIGGTGVAYGTITGFGSVWVNGVRYDSTGTTIKLDDNPVGQDDLRVGMVARVDGSVSGATATTITVDSAIKGRVEQVVGTDRFVIMGQTVQTDAQTVFENSVRPVVGDYVEVHGLPVSAGVVAASYIERKSALASPPYTVTGFVSGHDSGNQRFTIGNLTVLYASAITNDMPGASWDGLLVEVKGVTCAGTPVCATLTASKVEPGGLGLSSKAQAEVEGYVTSVTGSSFVLGGQQVTVTANTRYENGVAADLVVGAKLEAEGSISNGILTATKVSFRHNTRLEGNVLALTADGFTIAGLPGITVQITSSTDRDNDCNALAGGTHVRVRGRGDDNGVVVATELSNCDSRGDSRVELRGPVQSFGDPNVTLLGITVDTSGVSNNNFTDEDVSIGRSAFFGALTVGRAVKARGDLGGGNAVTWSEMELED